MDQLIEDNQICLDQGIQLLAVLSPSEYTEPCANCFGSTIGGHIRHNTDHYTQFLDGLESGRIDYDARSRNLEVEAKPEVARRLQESLKLRLGLISDERLSRRLLVRMDAGGASEWTESSVRRELQFLLSHTIHHYALIVAIGKTHGFCGFERGFGVAPSTLKFQEQASS